MIVFKLNFDAALAEARRRAEKMVENGLYSRFQLSNQKRIEKALLGCLGEIAFEYVLRVKDVDYELDNTDFSKRNSDDFDFLINGKKFDIKVAKKSTPRPPTDGWTYGYPKEQHPITKDYVVVGWIDFSKKEIGFYGWITGREISTYKVVTKNSFAKYPYLTPNHEFQWGKLNKNLDLILKN